MHTKRLGVGVAVVNRLLYAIGGFDGNERLASMECYHPENNEWTILPPMRIGRSGAGVAALNQYIYVVGGFDGGRQLASVERYDTENQVWDTVSSIRISRSALSLTVLEGKLYAMGGFDGQSFLSIVEVYDPAQNEWQEGTPLTSGRSGHASAVIYQPSCVPSYMDCIDATLNSNERSPPSADDDQSKGDNSSAPAPPSSSNQTTRNNQSTAPNGLHAFSGNRCQQCNDNGDTLPTITSIPNDNSESAYSASGQYIANMNHFLRMDCEDNAQNAFTASTNDNDAVESMHIDEPCSDVNNDFNDFSDDNPKKDRRKIPFQNEQSAIDNVFNGNQSNVSGEESCSSNNTIPNVDAAMNRSPDQLASHSQETEQSSNKRRCSLSSLKNKFVAWSSSRGAIAHADGNSTSSSGSTSSGSSSTSRRSSRPNDDNGNCELFSSWSKS